ncbi:hypothetical protein EDB19DRAFT_226478, partial [Suillus lakei]
MDIVLVFSGLFSARHHKRPSHPTRRYRTRQPRCSGLCARSASIYVVATHDDHMDPKIAYASLSMSLLAAFGAVLGKQWLGYYKSNRYGRGSQEERGKRRQETFDGLITWYFDAVVQSFPVLLQISLLLFGIALSANMWTEQPSIAWVIIATTVFGFLFYSLTVMACLISPTCPFQTPISTILRILRIDRLLRLVFKRVSNSLRKLTTSVHGVPQRLLGIVKSRWTRLAEAFRSDVLIYYYTRYQCSF